jgi:hypothetical protein
MKITLKTSEQYRLAAIVRDTRLSEATRKAAREKLLRLVHAPAPQVPVPRPVVVPRPSTFTAFEAAQAKATAARELELWGRNAALRLQQANTLGRTEEAEQIKQEMRRRGIRPIGDPDPPVADKPLAPAPEMRFPKIGRPQPTGAIVEFVNGGWRDWQGE